jgi:hypothetical protein
MSGRWRSHRSSYEFRVLAENRGEGLTSPSRISLEGLQYSEGDKSVDYRYLTASASALILCLAAITEASAQFASASHNSFAPPSETASMNTERYDAASTPLPNGNWLLAGGGGPTGAFLDSLEIYRWRTNTFVSDSALPAMSTLRANETATLLPNGTVLIAGGAVDNSTWTNTTDLYDPTTKTITPGPDMNDQREGAIATLLPNGLVLIAGGRNSVGTLASTDLYHPKKNTISPGPAMNVARYDCAIVRLPGGKLMIIGGFGAVTQSQPLASTEIYDPPTNTFAAPSATPTMNDARGGAQATRLPNGQVLVTGGTDSTGVVATTEIYHPAKGIFTQGPDMSGPRKFHSQILLPNGKVLIAGGYTDNTGTNVVSTTDLYHPATNTITPGPDMNDPRGLASRTLLPNGQVLIAGGSNGPALNATTDLYTP